MSEAQTDGPGRNGTKYGIDWLLKIPDAAEVLQVSVRKMNRMLADYEIPRVKMGRSSRVRSSDLQTFISEL